MKFSIVKITFDKECTDVVLEGLKKRVVDSYLTKITSKRIAYNSYVVYNYICTVNGNYYNSIYNKILQYDKYLKNFENIVT